jgi:hypothetical protein
MIWLLDFSEQNPKVNAEDCGKALAAEVNAMVQEHERRSPPRKMLRKHCEWPEKDGRTTQRTI